MKYERLKILAISADWGVEKFDKAVRKFAKEGYLVVLDFSIERARRYIYHHAFESVLLCEGGKLFEIPLETARRMIRRQKK